MARQVKLSKKFKILEDGGVELSLTYQDGEVVHYTLPYSLIQQAAGSGALRKIGDLANGVTDLNTLKENVTALLSYWDRGQWANRSPSNGTSIIQRALVEHTGKSVNEVKAFLKGKTMKEKADIKRMPGVAEIVARLEADEAPAPEGLLAGLVS